MYNGRVIIDRSETFLAGFQVRNPFGGGSVVERCGNVHFSRGHHLKPHRHSEIEVNCLLGGSLDFLVDRKVHTIRTGSTCIIAPGIMHDWPAGQKSDYHIAYVNLRPAVLKSSGYSVGDITVDTHIQVVQSHPLIESILTELPGLALNSESVYRTAGELLLAPLACLFSKYSSASAIISHGDAIMSTPTARSLQFMRRNLGRILSLEELATHLCLPVTTFHRKFTAEVGESPLAYHRLLRLTAAKQALLLPDATVSDVAKAFGFDSQQNFATAFKKQFAVTPRQWRDSKTSKAPQEILPPEVQVRHAHVREPQTRDTAAQYIEDS